MRKMFYCVLDLSDNHHNILKESLDELSSYLSQEPVSIDLEFESLPNEYLSAFEKAIAKAKDVTDVDHWLVDYLCEGG